MLLPESGEACGRLRLEHQSMKTNIFQQQWRRRGAAHSDRRPARKRERRSLGFLSPQAARLRRFMKRSSHRHTRRTVRASLRAYIATRTA